MGNTENGKYFNIVQSECLCCEAIQYWEQLEMFPYTNIKILQIQKQKAFGQSPTIRFTDDELLLIFVTIFWIKYGVV